MLAYHRLFSSRPSSWQQWSLRSERLEMPFWQILCALFFPNIKCSSFVLLLLTNFAPNAIFRLRGSRNSTTPARAEVCEVGRDFKTAGKRKAISRGSFEGASRECCRDFVLVSWRREASNGMNCEPWGGARLSLQKRQTTDASGQGTNIRDGALKTKTIHQLSRSADFQACQYHLPSLQGDSITGESYRF